MLDKSICELLISATLLVTSNTKSVESFIADNVSKIPSESLIIKSIEIKEMLSDKPGLARSYGSLTRMYFEKR